MSTFKVTVERIKSVEDHPNADRLDICTLESMPYQFVTGKHNYEPGHLVVYFPIDSVIDADLAEEMHIGHLVKNHKGLDGVRIKTIRLRGAISQGVVSPPSELAATRDKSWSVGDDVTDLLGVTKYEPPAVPTNNAKLLPLPPHVPRYDIEGTERFQHIFESIMDDEVVVTEKVEGSHFVLTAYRKREDGSGEDLDIKISQRNYSIQPDPDKPLHTWHKTAHDAGLVDAVKTLNEEGWFDVQFPGWLCISLRGELVGPGIQANHYRRKDFQVYLFEVEVDGVPLGYQDSSRVTSCLHARFGVVHAPVLYVGKLCDWLNGRSIEDASTGKSEINPDKLREGVVIKPTTEKQHPEIGRLFLKKRSPEYLAKTGL